MSLADAVIGLKAYKEVDKRMSVLWQGLDRILIRPRTSRERQDVPTIRVENVRHTFCDLWTMLTQIVDFDIDWKSRQYGTISSPGPRDCSRISLGAIARRAGLFVIERHDA